MSDVSAFDTRVWRVVGDPLVRAASDAHPGPLAGRTVAVKDLYAVAGQPIGAGNPAYLRHAPVQAEHAEVVGRLLDAGAGLRGIARTDEFAYSLAGANAHYGTPPNPAAPGRIPGGSSNGSATAVALGQADIGLGTDTGGSIRVPAAYQGLFGIRTSHDAVSRRGLLPLAPSFDAVGWLTRSAELLRLVGDVLLPPDGAALSGALVVGEALLALAHPDVADAISAWLPAQAERRDGPWQDLPAWLTAFQTVQAQEAWQSHGAWLSDRLDTLGADVRGRFETARSVEPGAAETAREVVSHARDLIRGWLGDRVLVLPSAPTVAPLPAEAAAGRTATLLLTCVAGIGGLPAVGVPLRTRDGLPCGACLVGPAGSDRALLGLAHDLGDDLAHDLGATPREDP